ncbi:hypothetical protein GCM10020331_094280 [Ectobacillus funiculus]
MLLSIQQTGFIVRKQMKKSIIGQKVGQVPPRYIGDLRQANYQDVLKYSVRTGAPRPELSALFEKGSRSHRLE